MDLEHAVDWLLGLVVAIGGWLLKQMHAKLEAVKDTLHEHKVTVARDYVRHEDMIWVKETLTRIEDKLDRKVDK